MLEDDIDHPLFFHVCFLFLFSLHVFLLVFTYVHIWFFTFSSCMFTYGLNNISSNNFSLLFWYAVWRVSHLGFRVTYYSWQFNMLNSNSQKKKRNTLWTMNFRFWNSTGRNRDFQIIVINHKHFLHSHDKLLGIKNSFNKKNNICCQMS